MSLPADTDLPDLTEKMIAASVVAGHVLMEEFNKKDLGAQTKKDGSPVLRADRLSNKVLKQELKKLGDYTVLSEEDGPETLPPQETQFFIIDPLDGTREFMSGSTDFVINIAFLQGGRPICGVIHSPATATTYYATLGCGAWRRHMFDNPEGIKVSERTTARVGITSLNHVKAEDNEVLERLGCLKILRKGSAIKFAEVACGQADVYFRKGRTMIWDTASADIIIREAGGCMAYYLKGQFENGFNYSLENLGFLCSNQAGDGGTLNDESEA